MHLLSDNYIQFSSFALRQFSYTQFEFENKKTICNVQYTYARCAIIWRRKNYVWQIIKECKWMEFRIEWIHYYFTLKVNIIGFIQLVNQPEPSRTEPKEKEWGKEKKIIMQKFHIYLCHISVSCRVFCVVFCFVVYWVHNTLCIGLVHFLLNLRLTRKPEWVTLSRKQRTQSSDWQVAFFSLYEINIKRETNGIWRECVNWINWMRNKR